MGVRQPAPHRRVADRGRQAPTPSRRRWSKPARCRPSARSRARSDDRRGRTASRSVRPPSITIVGAVAALAEQLAWREARPLAGRTVAVTRARAQASGLARSPAGAGRAGRAGAGDPRAGDPRRTARPEPLRPDLPDQPQRRRVAVRAPRRRRAARASPLAGRGEDRGDRPGHRDARWPSTASRADIVPERFVAEALVEALADVAVTRALVARAAVARDVLPDALRERGAEVDVLELYETVAEPAAPREIEAALRADYITFTSSSTVRFFLAAAGGAAAISADQQDRLDRAGDQRDAARAWPRAAHRGDPARHRRAARGAARRRRCRADRGRAMTTAGAARLGRPRVHLRRTDSTNERARDAGAGGRPARHAGEGGRAERRARASGPALVGARRQLAADSLVLRHRRAAAADRRGRGLRASAPAWASSALDQVAQRHRARGRRAG